MSNPKMQNSRCDNLVQKFMLLGVVAISCIVLSNSWAANLEADALEKFEIEGISINTPLGEITELLQARDYVQVSEFLYTKQKYVQNGRSAVFRVEIDDNPAFRQITYYRGMSGGRNKSPTTRDASIPDSDINMARQLYQYVCVDQRRASTSEDFESYSNRLLATIKEQGAIRSKHLEAIQEINDSSNPLTHIVGLFTIPFITAKADNAASIGQASAQELAAINQLMQSSAKILAEIQRQRACIPFSLANISFGRAQWIQIDNRFSAILNVTDTNATIGIKYIK
ncbi:hypothetical protein R2103_03705 [Nitrosomonas sp. Is24]|uniref:hypothetical protein n=1 Tax=Nitrosomonas sp. Is24 TaxID=3080533 RepID=UPI00294B84DA|nr:hypothetical protein [Nitrosomonas sp. Is24]MDV6340873.1 hypothetical protein [Nitrosomonas sp. Is24]